MTYEQAIEFFAKHGGLAKDRHGDTPTPGQLITQVPTPGQLLAAAKWAVQVERQPQSTADEAIRTIRDGWPSDFRRAVRVPKPEAATNA